MKKSIQYFIILLCFYCNADIDQLGDKLKYLGLANSGEFEAPTVLLITPISEAKRVSVNEEVSVLFSQPMDKKFGRNRNYNWSRFRRQLGSIHLDLRYTS